MWKRQEKKRGPPSGSGGPGERETPSQGGYKILDKKNLSSIFFVMENEITRRELLALLKLTEKQKVMCDNYIRHFDAELAMREAGYELPERTGGKQARLIEKAIAKTFESKAVQQYVKLMKESLPARLKISSDDVVEELRHMAFARIDDYIEWGVDGIVFVKDSKELTKAQKRGIMEVSSTETKAGTTVRVKLFNKQPALEKLYEILQELEAEKPKQPIRRAQINVMLQDPQLRKAVELIAEGLYEARVLLAPHDVNRMKFEGRVSELQGRLLDAGGHASEVRSEEGGRDQGEGEPGVDVGGDSEAALPEAAEEDRYNINGI